MVDSSFFLVPGLMLLLAGISLLSRGRRQQVQGAGGWGNSGLGDSGLWDWGARRCWKESRGSLPRLVTVPCFCAHRVTADSGEVVDGGSGNHRYQSQVSLPWVSLSTEQPIPMGLRWPWCLSPTAAQTPSLFCRRQEALPVSYRGPHRA